MNSHRINVSDTHLFKLLLASHEIMLSGHVCESAKVVVIQKSGLCADINVNRLFIGVFLYSVRKKSSGLHLDQCSQFYKMLRHPSHLSQCSIFVLVMCPHCPHSCHFVDVTTSSLGHFMPSRQLLQPPSVPFHL